MTATRRSFRRRKDDRPAEILVAAAREFRAEGYGGARMLGIAARAGISHGTLYRYFPDKAALLRAVFREALVDPIAAPGEMQAAFADLPPGERLPHALGHAVRRLVEGGGLDLLRILLFEADRHPEVVRPVAREVFARADAAIAAIAGSDVLPDPPLAMLGPGLLSALALAAIGAEDVAARAEEAMRSHARRWMAKTD